MKKIIVCLYILASSFLVSNSYGQNENYRELPTITVSAASSGIMVSTKLVKVFSRVFQSASNIRWYEIKRNFLVKFIQNDQENTALFTRSGNLVYHICYGLEQFLPTKVRKLVKSVYYDQTITRVLRVNQDNRCIWVISMKDDTQYIMARVEDMELEETRRITKSE